MIFKMRGRIVPQNMRLRFGVLACMLLVAGRPASSVAAEAPEAIELSPPSPAGAKDMVIAGANDTSLDILRSSDGLFAWKFIPYKTDTRLLVVLSTRYNTTVIWIANRERPVAADASLHVAFPSFELVLRDADGSAAWAASPGGVRRILLNTTGNLLLQNAHSNTVWASFDHLTDIILPGERIRTNHSMTSSLSQDDVRPGRYTLAAEPGGAVLYATFDSQQRQIPYKFVSYVEGVFSSTLGMVLGSACNHTSILYNSDGAGVTLQQEGKITPECARQASGELQDINSHGITFANMKGGTGFRYMRLLPTGDVSTFFLTERGLEPDNGLFANFFGSCQLPSYCGVNSFCSSTISGVNCSCPQLFHPFDPSDLTQGCVLDTPLDCNKSREHQFLQINGGQYFANAFNLTPVYHVRGPDECKSACLANCSCTAAFFDNATSACHLYDQVRTMNQGSPSVTAFLRVAKLPPQSLEAVPLHKGLIIGLSFAVGAVVLCLVFGAAWVGRRIMRSPPPDAESDLEEESFLESLPGLPPRYSYKELHAATQGFSKKLGVGGSGAVYEGALPDPAFRQSKGGSDEAVMRRVAVKELTLSERATIAACSKKLFRAEVASLGSASHVNLVQLRGFCAEGSHRLLVYEFMENGSLDTWIFKPRSTQTTASNEQPRRDNDDEAASRMLSWKVRLRIAQHTARGLAFLHEECRDKVVHLDVKPQNILLDAGFRAKLADFGLCKLIDREQVLHQTVTAMRGTPGYMAPEWFLNLPVTDKSDVFSYGMVLLELIGGRKNVNMAAANEDEWYFPAWAVKQAEAGRLLDVVDNRLRHDSNPQMEEEMRRGIHVAFWCIQEGAASRPAMSTVLLMLEGHLPVPNPPLELTYVLRSRPDPVPGPSDNSGSLSTAHSTAAFSSVLLPR